MILLPAVSTEISTGQSPGQGRPRNKRSPGSLMPGGHGPGGAPAPGPSPQTANADANAYAKFLVKYMELDDITRQNIGHQVSETILTYTMVSTYMIHHLFHQLWAYDGIFGSVSGLLTACTYAGWDCGFPRMWYPFQDSKYGNCFIFNGNSDRNDTGYPRNSSLTGLSNGEHINN